LLLQLFVLDWVKPAELVDACCSLEVSA